MSTQTSPIKPTVGRMVYFYREKRHYENNQEVPATIVRVREDDTVDLGVFGDSYEFLKKVPIALDGAKNKFPAWGWMAFQVGQAKKPDLTADEITSVKSMVKEFGSRAATVPQTGAVHNPKTTDEDGSRRTDRD